MSLKESLDVLLSDDKGYYDISIDEDGDFSTNNAFDSAIIVSILSDKRASRNEVPRAEFRRGWIGNESTPNFEIGSKIWLLHQSRRTINDLNKLRAETEDCLKWMVSEIANSISVVVNFTEDGAKVDISTETSADIVHKTYILWQNTGE